ncbi:TonB-dependent receptor plug domain-containing protein [Flavobacteriaceae bacterium Ap0902]|nr:TonB-dependent receptor plug domain-containing protein [Flavobacteriaceae bacterium Ap0902]
MSSSFAQVKDTILLDQLLITGQVVPSKINQSVYAVQVISAEQIQQSAANNLADLLNQSLNIQIIPNNETGKSGISMFGLGSQYVKVLVDNIPLINDEGFGNFTDFSQINVDDIEQIEIVEGSMGVEYGADAVAGVINIITKKKSHKLDAQLYAQEETVGDEYRLYGRGRHIKGLKISSPIYESLTGTLSVNENKFDGWFHDKKGKKYYENQDFRGHAFRPKDQYDIKSSLNYKLAGGNIFYTLNYYNELLEKNSDQVALNYNPATDLIHPIAQDERFTTNRWRHHLNFYHTIWKDGNINLSASYQSQQKELERYTYHIIQDSESHNEKRLYESRKAYYAKAMLGKAILPEVWHWQIGAEINQVKGFQSAFARSVDSSTENIERELGSYDVFTSSKLHVSNQWTVRPGIRALFSSRFSTEMAYSLSTSYQLNPSWEIRAMFGDAPKHPSYEQLFTYFVDSNHYVVGDEDLKPEESQSVFLHLFYKNDPNNTIRLSAKLSGWHLKVKDQIDLIITQDQPLQYAYQNFETYQNQGLSLSGQLAINRFSAQIGVIYDGEGYDSKEGDMLYSWNANAGINYALPKCQLAFSTHIKRNGKEYSWRTGSEDGELIKGTRQGYTWWDMSIKKDFLRDWQIVAGARNLLDVKEIENTTKIAGAHEASSSTEAFAYGRSYFIKLTYQIPF